MAPWVEEHPDVFNDPNFSVSLTANNTCHDDMEISLPQDKYMDLPYVSLCVCVCVCVCVCACACACACACVTGCICVCIMTSVI